MNRNLQYPFGITPKMVQALHAYYVAHTRRPYLLNERIEEGWLRLLSAQTLAGEAVTIQHVQIVIRYLQKRVIDPRWKGPRHPGCLKLTADNFFCIEKFQNDLAEAQAILDACKRPKQLATKTVVQQLGDVNRQVEISTQTEPAPIDESTRQFLADLEARRQRRAKQS